MIAEGGSVVSTAAEERPARSGIVLPPGTTRRSGWWSWCRENRRRHRLLRVGVFVVGLLLILVGAAMWLFSALLAVPPVFIGLWLWSREFHWGHRLFRAFLRVTRSLASRVKARPMRWAVITVVGVGAAWGGFWAWGHYGLPTAG